MRMEGASPAAGEELSEDNRPRIPASEILAKIEKGEPLKYDGVVIEGDLEISKLDLPTEHVERADWQKILELLEDLKVIRSSIEITNSHIQGNLDFSNSILRGNADFMGSRFRGDAHFYGTIFSGYAFFRLCTFNRDASFMGSKFSEDAVFRLSIFDKSADFRLSKFSKNANFMGSKFSDYAVFSGSTFSKIADFMRSRFSGDALFSGSTFSQNTIVRLCTFNRDADFSGSTFRGDAHFSRSIFSVNADFKFCRFNGEAVFNGSAFGNNADFMGSRFRGDAHFYGSIFNGDADFKRCSFNGERLDFRGSRFDRLQDQEFPCRRAKQLAQNLGDKEEADNYYYREMEGRRIRLQEEEADKWEMSFPIQRTIELNTDAKRDLFDKYRYVRYNLFEAIFIQRIFGYGVRPYQLAAWWLLAVSVFALIYYGLQEIHRSQNGTILDNNAVTLGQSIYFSIITSATPGYGGFRPEGYSELVASVQAILGTFMWAAFITTFVRKYMR
ncbi:MAG TPA: pentapeptide repeat-containing protein [Methanotrichaceae archaeon]|nr:pentapeptide repeat-containing protein [Methanotrichaceae archaeon]HQF16496.1 pentapeptide repeat-containing protein [Methanotrichaceae archaeon]HQI91133.1 pentapeptide repeat-containing protein [Methanotrichaceae archaeon]HQJ28476.1 pentapeptide repeat-containing protein [Methanotrichaceae archaeon]